MKLIALALLSVGLCFYTVYYWEIAKKYDWVAGLISLIAAIMVLLG